MVLGADQSRSANVPDRLRKDISGTSIMPDELRV
jgi:hypothetical protein